MHPHDGFHRHNEIWSQVLDATRTFERQVARIQARRSRKQARKQASLKFPQFQRLPLELRQFVWEAFCPGLAATLRLYCFDLVVRKFARDGDRGQRSKSDVKKHRVLQDQTESARIVMAVHRESRHFASRALPDTLSFSRGRFDIRFNKKNDIISLEHGDLDVFNMLAPPLTELFAPFINLKHVYVQLDYSMLRMKNLLWCVTDKINHHQEQHCRRGMFPGLPDDTAIINGLEYDRWQWCWPDLATPRGLEYAKNSIHMDRIAAGYLEGWEGMVTGVLEDVRREGMGIWPLIEFPQDHGEASFRKLESYARADDPRSAAEGVAWVDEEWGSDMEPGSIDSWETDSDDGEEDDDDDDDDSEESEDSE